MLGIFVLASIGAVILARSSANSPEQTSTESVLTNTQQSTSDVGILYASKEGLETAQIFRADLDGKNSRRLTTDFSSEHEWARPSPDGKSILFMKADKGSSVNFAVQSNRMWIMNVDGSNQREVISIQKRNSFGWTGIAHAEWSPDSTKIVLAATLPNFTSQLFTVDTLGNNPEQLTSTITVDGQPANVLDPSWSKSNKIVYVRQWNCLGICGNHDVYTLDYATRQETRITNDPHWNYDPYISPDGSMFLWLSFRSSIIACPCDLIRGSFSGQLNPSPVIADGGANTNGTFSSDSQRILFLKQVGLKQVLHQINTDGSNLIRLGNGETGIASFIPATAPTSFPPKGGSPDTRSPSTGSSPQTPGTPDSSAGGSNQPQRRSDNVPQNQSSEDGQKFSLDGPLTEDVKNIITANPVAKQIKRNPVYAILGIIVGAAFIITGIILLRRNIHTNNSFNKISYS
jgi:Tol biopolymer transport system component